MGYSISQALYRWMHKRRIVSAVADEMGIDDKALVGLLNSSGNPAKLDTDKLSELCEAVYRLGYGRELNKILRRYFDIPQDPSSGKQVKEDLVGTLRTFTESLVTLTDTRGRFPGQKEEAELVRLGTIIRTEVFPAVMQIENIVDSQLKKVRLKNSDPNSENP